MGAIQESLNQMVNSGMSAVTGYKAYKVAKAYTDEQKVKEEERKQEEKTVDSYKKALTNELAVYDSEKLSGLKNPDKFLDKANKEYLKTTERMRLQRESWRMYRNQFKPDSPEYAEAEAKGQANKNANIVAFREKLANNFKMSEKRRGRPRKNGGNK